MKRKYLDDIGVADRPDTWCPNDDRQPEWDKEQAEYGFDERETWSMEYTFYCWLYERLKMFLDVNCIDLTFHKFEFEGETLTQQECIDRMLTGCATYFNCEDYRWDATEEEVKIIEDVAKIWALVLPAMWW